MTIWAFVLLIFASPGGPPAGSTSVGTEALHAPLVYSAYENESEIPSREYGLPDRDNEREGEEEDGKDSKDLRALLIDPLLDRPSVACARLDQVNRWVLGHGTSSRSSFLRC